MRPHSFVFLTVIAALFSSSSSTLPIIDGLKFVLEADRHQVCMENYLELSYHVENATLETVRVSPPPAIFLAYGWTIVYLEIRDAHTNNLVDFPVIIRDTILTPDWPPERIASFFYITLDAAEFIGRRVRMKVRDWKLSPGEYDLQLRYENFGPRDWKEADRVRYKVAWGVLKSNPIRINLTEDCGIGGE